MTQSHTLAWLEYWHTKRELQRKNRIGTVSSETTEKERHTPDLLMRTLTLYSDAAPEGGGGEEGEWLCWGGFTSSVELGSETHIIKKTMMKQSKDQMASWGQNSIKTTTKRSTMSPTTDINGLAPAFWNRFKRKSSYILRIDSTSCKFKNVAKLSTIIGWTKSQSSRKHANIILTPLKPHFYIVKLGFTGVYIIFLISAQKHGFLVLVRTASPMRL